jgi:hypothetical protein
MWENTNADAEKTVTRYNDVIGVKIRQQRPDPLQTSSCTMLVFGDWIWT